jgi:2-dehydro-3-deoxy-D-arabinonate dehydratase
MHLFRFMSVTGPHLGLETGREQFDLSAAAPELANLSSWLALPDPIGAIQDVISASRHPLIPATTKILPPIDVQEVWACGVTYLRSKTARMGESSHEADFYDRVYDAERPEIFFKASAKRVVGHGEPIRIRRDSSWNVPEPELALVLSSAGKIVGYTIGNDVSSRSIEGENPLYLPQAKVYDGSCALGPVIALHDGTEKSRQIHMIIVRDGHVLFEGKTSTSALRRTMEELARYLFRELSFESGVFLLTGAGIVPPDDFTLQPDDRIRITIEGIGTLENSVAGR